MLEYVQDGLLSEKKENNSTEIQASAIPILKPKGVELQKKIAVTKNKYRVIYDRAVRISRMIDNDNWGAKMQLYEMLKKWGIIDELENAGLQKGHPFSVGKIDFEWD